MPAPLGLIHGEVLLRRRSLPRCPPLSPSFNKVVFLLRDHSIWSCLKILMEVQQMGPRLLLEQQLAGQELCEPPCAGLIFLLNKPREPQKRATAENLIAYKRRPPACALKLLEIRPRSGQSCVPCGSSWTQLFGHAILHHPRQFEDGLLVNGQPKRKFFNESMVLQVGNLHMRIGDTSPYPCFSAQFDVVAYRYEEYFAQDMVMWSEAFMWGSDYSELLLDLASGVATRLLMISNYWYAKLSFYHVLPLEILVLFFRPMVFAAQRLDCQKWNTIYSVSLGSQDNIIASFLKYQLCSHTTNEIYGQQRFWNSLYACKTVNSCNF